MDERTTYHDDFYGWSREQADVLRLLRDRPGLPNSLDLDHVIEEIEGVGSSQLSSVESYLRLILLHLIKMTSSRNSGPKGHLRSEIVGFHADLVSRYSRSMHQQIDIDKIWRQARDQAEALLEDHGEEIQPTIERDCPLTLDELLAEPLDLPALFGRVERGFVDVIPRQ